VHEIRRFVREEVEKPGIETLEPRFGKPSCAGGESSFAVAMLGFAQAMRDFVTAMRNSVAAKCFEERDQRMGFGA